MPKSYSGDSPPKAPLRLLAIEFKDLLNDIRLVNKANDAHLSLKVYGQRVKELRRGRAMYLCRVLGGHKLADIGGLG